MWMACKWKERRGKGNRTAAQTETQRPQRSFTLNYLNKAILQMEKFKSLNDSLKKQRQIKYSCFQYTEVKFSLCQTFPGNF